MMADDLSFVVKLKPVPGTDQATAETRLRGFLVRAADEFHCVGVEVVEKAEVEAEKPEAKVEPAKAEKPAEKPEAKAETKAGAAAVHQPSHGGHKGR